MSNYKYELSIILGLVVFLSIGFVTAQTQQTNKYQDWEEVIEYQLSSFQHFGEDYSRTSPPYRSHVTFSFSFKNKTSRKNIAGIAFKARFIDSFGDVIRTTSTLKLHTNINPGEIGGLGENMWYYENQPYQDNDPYDKLAPVVRADNLKAEVNFVKVAFKDGTVVEYPQTEWSQSILEREKKEREWKEAFASWEGQGTKKTSVFEVISEKWKISYLAFEVSGKSPLRIIVYDKAGNIVQELTAELKGVAPTGDFVMDTGPGEYFLEIKGQGADSEWHVNVHEPRE